MKNKGTGDTSDASVNSGAPEQLTPEQRRQQLVEVMGPIETKARQVKRALHYSDSMSSMDIAQNVVERLVKQIDNEMLPKHIQIGSPLFFGYVHKMVRNIIADSRRAPRNRDREHVDELPDAPGADTPDDALMQQGALDALNDFFNGKGTLGERYTAQQRQQMVEMLRLNVDERMSADAIALVLPIPRTTVNNWLRLIKTKVVAEYRSAPSSRKQGSKSA